MKYKRSFLKWAGGKYHSLAQIIASMPSDANRLIEPFAGSAVIFMNTHFDSYLIGEINPDLIGLYQCLQQEGSIFIDYCATFFCDENNLEKSYYRLRERFNASADKKERAALFLYLNRHGYNGLCRYNQSGHFNVPFGRYSKPLFPKDSLEFFHQKSNNVMFRLGDFQSAFAMAEKGDLIYCDPPYVPINQTSNFTSYTQHKFGEEEQILLVELSIQAAKKGATVIISNHDTPFTRHHYRDAKMTSFYVPRHISSNIENRKPVKELLAIFD